MEDLYLAHHGVKGQRWGIRRYQNPDGTRIHTGRRSFPTKDGKNTKEIAKEDNGYSNKEVKTIREDREHAIKENQLFNMTDEELAQRIGRLQQEKKLKDLTEESLHPGRKAVTDSLKNVGTKVVISAAIGALAFGGKLIIDRMAGRKPDTSNMSPEEAKEKIKEYEETVNLFRTASNYIFPNPNKK